MMRLFFWKIMLAAAFTALCARSLHGQTPLPLSEAELLCLQAEDQHQNYDFQEAVAQWQQALGQCRDSLRRISIQENLSRSLNGVQMMQYCSRPKVVARERFSLSDFFLYYPLPDKSWHPAPNQLDSLGGDWTSAATYMPEGARRVYFSAADTLGVRNLYETHFADTAWTAPALLPFSSAAQDAYPLAQGDQLFFSSRGLYGVGGYDLYVTRRNPATGAWGVPENLGFPYSSPSDDFLFLNTEDGKYSIFASNRGCAADSVYIYVLEYESMPVRSAVNSIEELRRLCTLDPGRDRKKVDHKAALSDVPREDGHTARYRAQMASVRRLCDSLSLHNAHLEELRARYAAATGSGRESLSAEIMAGEAQVPALQARLDSANRALQAIEMDFLLHGVVIDPRTVAAESDQEVVGVDNAYTFIRKNLGPDLTLPAAL